MNEVEKKRAKIREGVAQTIPPLNCVFCVHFGYCEWKGEGLCQARYELADSIMWCLHSQGVVIKAYIEGMNIEIKGNFKSPQELSAVEPLIKEEK